MTGTPRRCGWPVGLRVTTAVLLGCCTASTALAAPEISTSSLKQLSVEELMNVEVYSASRHLESSHTSPTATFVITNADIRRSHATSVPELLRLVPGVQVGRVDANKWAVSMRGFNSREANKLLVLVDGRSIYDPLFSGMLWEAQDFMLEDIDRIEVIRGPGGTLWGANAFNGIINIVTRSAADTQGALASLRVGNEEEYTLAARYGFQPTERQSLRFYAKGLERDTGLSETIEPYDGSRMRRGGFRWDWSNGERDQVRVSGDLFKAETGVREDLTLVQDVEHKGSNVLTRWDHAISPDNSLRAQFYYDHVDYASFGYTQERDTYDLELQQSVRLGSRHLVVWGAGLRELRDDTRSGLAGFVDILPLHRADSISSFFGQDTYSVVPERLNLTVGLKYEHTDYAPAEWLPNVRLAWTPSADETWWASFGEATRVPSRLESDLTFFNVIRIGDRFRAEHVRAYEVGQRRLVTQSLWYDLALFYNDYDDLRTGEAGGQLGNLMYGHSAGAELAVRWEPTEDWRIDVAYTYLAMGLSLDPRSTSNPGQLGYIEGLGARNQASLRSALDLAPGLQVDTTLRYVGQLQSLGIPSYTELDVGLTWNIRSGVDLSLAGRNLLHSHHPEQDFAFSASGMPTDVERSVYGGVTWQF
jgi:iron complex outermembrane recepter protein